MGLDDVRRRLPVVGELPTPDDRKVIPVPEGAVPIPRIAVWEITLACDQKCIHCGSRAGVARPGELSTEECLKLIDELRELGVGEVVLLGGEAYLRNDFILLIRAIREQGMASTLTTGALNLTQARIDAMKEAGINQVNVSIDGTKEAHDTLRGVAGSFDAAVAALERLRSAGVQRSVNSQINSLTKDTLLELVEVIGPFELNGWQLQITSPFGHAGDHPELLLQPYMYPEVFDMLDRLVDRAAHYRLGIWPANNLGYFGPYAHKLRRYQKRGGHYKGCHAGRSSIGIEADGSIKGCPSLGGSENRGGNWRDHGLLPIWAGAPELQYTRTRSRDVLWGYCAECYYADTCMGGCTATSEPLLGRPGNNPFCHHRALEMNRMGMRERVELVVKGAGEPFDHGLYRLVREHLDPAARARHGPVRIDEPRVSRCVEPDGAGRDIGPNGQPEP